MDLLGVNNAKHLLLGQLLEQLRCRLLGFLTYLSFNELGPHRWLEQQPNKREVVGSIPSTVSSFP